MSFDIHDGIVMIMSPYNKLNWKTSKANIIDVISHLAELYNCVINNEDKLVSYKPGDINKDV